jgi:CHASE3 domain sensor protein
MPLRRLRIRRRIQVLFVGLFLLVLIGVGVDTFVEGRRDDATQTINQRLVPARDQLHLLATAVVDQETGQRGYLLTGRDEFLEPYRDGRRQTTASLERLRKLLADDPSALAGIDRVSSRISAWQQLAADFEIDVKRSGRDEVVSTLVSSGTGLRLFEKIRTEIADVSLLLDHQLLHQRERTEQLQDRLVLVRAVNVLAALLLLAIANRQVNQWITQPLGRLGGAVRGAASGALDAPIPPVGPPDLAELAADVDAMRRRILVELDDATRARAALADRGMIVVTLRDDLAPSEVHLPRGIQVAGGFRPAKGLVAGDWYEVVRLDDDRIAVALVDVSGHGAEVATFALRTKALTMAAIGTQAPGEAMTWLASHLGETGELFLTGVIIEVSASTGVVRYASAGHPPLLLAGVSGVTKLGATGPLLGPLPGTWETAEARLDRGGVLLAYSDGLVEARNLAGEQFGIERLIEAVVDAQLSGVDAVARTALTAAERFASANGSDDITLCVVGR